MPGAVSRPLVFGGVWMRSHLPDGGHCQPVNLADFGEREQFAAGPWAGTQCLAVHPLSCARVAAGLPGVLEFLAADRLAFAEKCLNFSQDQGVALQGG